MPFVTTRDGVSLFYSDWGAGPPVVLIHGWPLNADMWEYQARVLAEAGFRVISYDRRGFGRSSQPWSGYDYDTLAADLGSVLDALDLTQVTLVGFSMGGGEVVRYLARYGRGRVARAALISAVTPFLLKTDSNPGGVDRTVFDDMVGGLQQDRPHFLNGFGRKFFGAGLLNFKISADMLQWAQVMALQASPKASIACVRAFSQTDFRPDLAALDLPVLIVHGTADQTVPVTAGQATAKLLPAAAYVEYEGAPHALFYTERDRLNEDLIAFIRS